MPAVVSDSSPFVYLARIQRFGLLRTLFDQILVPEAVWEEVAVASASNPEDLEIARAATAGWLKVERPSGDLTLHDQQLRGLGVGEREAILLALEKRALLIIDETEGRKAATRLAVHTTGTLGVLIQLFERALRTVGEPV